MAKTCSGVKAGNRCGAPATLKATFPDKTVEFMCSECVQTLAQVAEDMHSKLYAEKISEKDT